jgi:hypothetical protein
MSVLACGTKPSPTGSGRRRAAPAISCRSKWTFFSQRRSHRCAERSAATGTCTFRRSDPARFFAKSETCVFVHAQNRFLISLIQPCSGPIRSLTRRSRLRNCARPSHESCTDGLTASPPPSPNLSSRPRAVALQFAWRASDQLAALRDWRRRWKAKHGSSRVLHAAAALASFERFWKGLRIPALLCTDGPLSCTGAAKIPQDARKMNRCKTKTAARDPVTDKRDKEISHGRS